MSTRSELKENILATKIETLLVWVMANRGQVITVAGIALGAILIGSVFFLRNREKRQTDLTRLAVGESLVQQRQYDRAALALKDLSATVSDNSIKAQTSYFQGLAALGLKKFDEAERFFQDAFDLSGQSLLKPLTLSNKGFAQEEQRKFDDAAQTYTRFMTEFGEHFLAPRVQLSLGRVLMEAGKREEAKQALTHLIDLYPTSQWAENARSIMDKLKIR